MGDIFGLVVALAFIEGLYLAFVGWPLYLVGKAFDLDHRWMAFIPGLGAFVLTSAADMTHWFLLLLFVPLIKIIVGPYLWARVCSESGQNEVKGWLTLVPLLNIIMVWVIATSASSSPYPAYQRG